MGLRQQMAQKRKAKQESRYLYCFDGIAGAGKTSVVNRVKKELKDYYGKMPIRSTSLIPKMKGELSHRTTKRIIRPSLIPIAVPAAAVIGLERMTKRKGITLFDRSPISLIAKDQRLRKKSDIEKAAKIWAEFYREKGINTIYMFKIKPETAERRISEREEGRKRTIYDQSESLGLDSWRYELASKVFEEQGYKIKVIEVDEKTSQKEIANKISDEIIKEIRAKVMPTRTS